jgi:hypothetical protein
MTVQMYFRKEFKNMEKTLLLLSLEKHYGKWYKNKLYVILDFR